MRRQRRWRCLMQERAWRSVIYKSGCHLCHKYICISSAQTASLDQYSPDTLAKNGVGLRLRSRLFPPPKAPSISKGKGTGTTTKCAIVRVCVFGSEVVCCVCARMQPTRRF
jgi:hypothetical protein